MKIINTQKGNVLFLILIAVALFAALSYAVTQSSRSGGDAGRETNVLNAAQLTQYPNQVRTAIVRLVIEGTGINSIEFNPPASIVTAAASVFSPSGGGAVFQDAPADMMAGSTDGTWFYNGNFNIPQIGSATGDLVAFLPGVSLDVCNRINLEAGIGSGTPPVIGTDFTGGTQADYDYNLINTNSIPSSVQTLDNGANDFTAEPYGCFDNGTSSTGVYVYYHALYER